jgi:hypothetical protein
VTTAVARSVDVRVAGLAPAAHALIWRDNDSAAEVRVDLLLLARLGACQARLLFEFPKLYKKVNLPLIDGLGKPGWQERPSAFPSASAD